KIVSIVFENGEVPASFQPNLNTETAIIFRVPLLAQGGNQNIVLTNIEGKTLSVPFEVLLPPAISSVFPTDFQAGSTLTITGNNLADVTDVVISGTTDAATIVSKTLTQLVVTMPASEVNTGKIAITNLAGTTTTEQVVVNVDKALQVFSDDLMNGFQSWSWGGTYEPSTDVAISGPKSMKAAFDPSGTWGGLQLGNNGSINIADYKYFTFWIKGADVEKKFQYWINWGNQKQIVVPANVWTYYKYDLMSEFPGVTDVNNVTFQIYDEGHTVYFDNIIFYKD
ncbi:MAG TPA: IPT/TIG domain-containing protein, partial [Bacteroidales bacterium]|nr:IPT/TIG domain-containing protein [Bacteroidales bacterium]